jgi:UDP-2,3-diacylglucosamine hydrolase
VIGSNLFISDLHLDASRPHVTRFFLKFLERDARDANALYILGDLFEAWIGDDDNDAHHRAVMSALRSFTSSERPCLLLRGNRDFLIGADFCAETGVQLLAEPTVTNIAGERVLLMHGDTLCTDDHDYQAFRRRVRNPRLQALFLALPLSIRRLIAAQARHRSQTTSSGKPAFIMDVNQQAVAAALRENGVRCLLHGHTHRPGIHHFDLDGAQATRIVLGDWYHQGSVLRWSTSGHELLTLSFG